MTHVAEASTRPATTASDLVPEAAAFVFRHFKENLDEAMVFHGYQHTIDVVEAAGKIGRKEGLDENDHALVKLAAWFHDTGFTDTYDGHEDASVRIARTFLAEKGLPEEQINQIENLIWVTHLDHEPETLLQQVIRDADIAHIGRKLFFERSQRLRDEWAHYRDETYTDEEWTELQLNFLYTTRFYTEYAKQKYGKRKRKNIKALRRQLAALMDRAKPVPTYTDKSGSIPKRGKETMFRAAYRTHINLSSIADAKANIMISINAILMSIIVSFISTRNNPDAWLLIPAGTLLFTSLIAIVFAILSARPKVTSQVFTLDDVRNNQSNILFFGNFVNLPLETFKAGIREIIHDWDRLYDSMASDLHSLGQVLAKKYRLLWLSYTVFMAGLVLSVLLLAVLFFVQNSGTLFSG